MECRAMDMTVAPKDCDGCAYLVSHGYRRIVSRDVLSCFPNRAINLHISLLPWNRGADPNLWSWAEATPKGVSIHLMDEGIDTGPIIAKRPVEMYADDGWTLATSYTELQRNILDLFRETWPSIYADAFTATAQVGAGSAHRIADKNRLAHLLARGWDTPCAVFDCYAAELQLSAAARDSECADVANAPAHPRAVASRGEAGCSAFRKEV
jgi:methionyl-tRNA formyltransferase